MSGSAKTKFYIGLAALPVGITACIGIFNAYLSPLLFLSVIGTILAVLVIKKKPLLGFIGLAINGTALSYLIYAVILVNYSSHESSRHIVMYYFPKNYTEECMTIMYNTPNGMVLQPEIKNNKKYYHYFIPETGILAVSSPAQTEPHTAQYFWYDNRDTVRIEEYTSFNPDGLKINSSFGDDTEYICTEQ